MHDTNKWTCYYLQTTSQVSCILLQNFEILVLLCQSKYIFLQFFLQSDFLFIGKRPKAYMKSDINNLFSCIHTYIHSFIHSYIISSSMRGVRSCPLLLRRHRVGKFSLVVNSSLIPWRCISSSILII